MTVKEVRTMSKTDLVKRLATLREQLRDLRFKIHSKEVKNNHQLIAVRRDVARILTILNEQHGKA